MSDTGTIRVEGGKVIATVGKHSMEFPNIEKAGAWVDAVTYGYQPDNCIFGGGHCGYPIEECYDCPFHPNNYDWNYPMFQGVCP